MKTKLVRDLPTLKECASKLNPDLIYFDTESIGLNRGDSLLGISLFSVGSTPFFVSLENEYYSGISLEDAREVLNPIFKKAKGVAHNAKYDLWIFEQFGFYQIEVVFDTLLAIHIFNPDPSYRKKLETRLEEDLGWKKKTFEELMSVKWDKIKWGKDETLEILAQYSCEDVYGTMLLHEFYEPKLTAGQKRILFEIEIPLAIVLKDMKERGVYINVEYLKELEVRLDKGIQKAQERIFDLAGCLFNINSGKQKAEVLFDRLGLPSEKTTKGGARSTDREVLVKLANSGNEIAEELLLYSEYNKLLTTYVRGIPNLIDSDGRLRGDFNSTGAVTGRMSSSNPNLQNQPNNSNFPIRRAFEATEGHVLIIADWSQIELRVMAHESKDKELTRAFILGEDIHGFVANQLGITRKQAKTVNFGIMYGMGPDSLSALLGITPKEASVILDEYHRIYRGFYLWKKSIEKFAQENGYVRNMFGRIRHLPGAMSYGRDRSIALRQAVNTVIQGGAADLMKKTLLRMARAYREENLIAYPLLLVHDEFVVEARENVKGRLYHSEQVYDRTVEIMEKYIKLSVPVVADGKICQNWHQMKEDHIVSLAQQRKEFEALLFSNLIA